MCRPRRKKKESSSEKGSEAPLSRGLFPLPKSYKRFDYNEKNHLYRPQHEIINTLEFSSKLKARNAFAIVMTQRR